MSTESGSGSEIEVAETIAAACRMLGFLGVSYAALGHVSYREAGSDWIYIKGKGPDENGLRFTSVHDIIKVDFDAEVIEGRPRLQSPSEVFLHLGLYKNNPELRSVVHVHPEHAVLLTICDKPILPIIGAYGPAAARIAINGVRTYPRTITISNPELGREFAEFAGTSKVTMMRAHGATIVGDSIEDATVRAVSFSQLARMTCKAYMLGQPQPIPDEDLAAFRGGRVGPVGRGSAPGRAGVLAVWRYYRALEMDGRGPLSSIVDSDDDSGRVSAI